MQFHSARRIRLGAVADVAGGPYGGAHLVALDSTGRVWAWGDNGTGDVGDGTETNALAPTAVHLPAAVHVVQIAAGGTDSLAIDRSGELWAWGNSLGFGGGATFDLSRFGQGAGNSDSPIKVPLPAGVRLRYVAAGGTASVGVDQHGNAWTTGDNSLGQLGDGTTNATSNLGWVRLRMPAGVHWTAAAAGGTSNTLFGFVAAKPVPAPGRWSLSTLASSLLTPSQAIKPVSSLAVNGVIAVVAAMFLTFPSNLFNSTFEDNYAEINEWWARRRDRRRGVDVTRSRWAFVVVLLVGGLLNCLVDPTFGWHRSSMTTYVAVLFSMALGMAVTTAVTVGYHRARGAQAGPYLHALPLGLVVAAISVLVSRAAGFQPGYVYGVVIAIAFARQLSTPERGHLAALSAYAALLLGIGAWFAIVPVTHYESAHGLSVGIVLLHNVLATLFTSGLVRCVFGLMPLAFLPGARLRAWSPRAWALTFTVCLFGLIQVLLRPHTSRPSHAPLLTTLGAFLLFGVTSVATRHFFARRTTTRSGGPPPPLRQTLAELIPRQRGSQPTDLPATSTTE